MEEKERKFVFPSCFKRVPDYRDVIEDYVQRGYTIGDTIIFPKYLGSVNQAKVIIIRKKYFGVRS